MTDFDLQLGLPIEPTSSRRGVTYRDPAIPRWAAELVDAVVAEYAPDRRPPAIEWRQRRRGVTRREPDQLGLDGLVSRGAVRRTMTQASSTSGVTYTAEGRIRIRVGTETHPEETRMVLLHELAHWLAPGGEHHGTRFWRTAWTLYVRHLRPESLPAVRYRERAYRTASERAYRAIVGATGDTISLWGAVGAIVE